MRVSFLLRTALIGRAVASPTADYLQTRQLSLVNNLLNDVLSQITGQVGELNSAVNALFSQLDDVVPTATPTSIEDVVSIVKEVTAATPTALIENVVKLAANSLAPQSFRNLFETYSTGVNSENNVNPDPPQAIYPSKAAGDAVYTVSEAKLRAAIHIPSTFTYGQKQPVILVPGTGTKGGFVYGGNLAKLLPQEDFADPVWLNIPGFLLDDVHVNSEYSAYAINYISSITSRNVSVVGWSQGNLNTQWALTFWPSTREVVTDSIAVSPDYHGLVLAYLLCPKLGHLPCAPSVHQQKWDSELIQTFRNAGGASAWAPTTVVWSATDDIVQPNHGTNASSFLQDTRNVGVTNVELQLACPLLSDCATLYALLKDALTHDGPASIQRISDFNTACSKIAADGLSVQDIIATTVSVPVAVAGVLLYDQKVVNEPAIASYAQSFAP
ncbi:unnamed protein product [Clonostachys rosea]|uniref:AB hydrolase-1 domain-containing protein n=1 Tax=Bionectria ochroleuca TaxID=29856 RepID=A0ABY6V4W8_BIOOC|nr:unnamed protein product [Clonostachys rosea]